MPYLADFQCSKCGNTSFDVMFSSHAEFLLQKEARTCCSCGGRQQHVMLSPPAVEIKEVNDIYSAKPLSYWNNAERVKQAKIKKRNAEEKEKTFYRDPETLRKERNRKINAERFRDEED